MRARRRAFRVICDGTATQAKHAGDFVAQREFIRIAPATPEAMSLLESCGVADKMAISGGCPGTVNWTSYRARTSHEQLMLQLPPLPPLSHADDSYESFGRGWGW